MIDRYVVVLEDAGSNFSAYIPDLPGCIATGATVEETITNIREAMAIHLDAMRRDGDVIPAPEFGIGDPPDDVGSAIGVVELSSAPEVLARDPVVA